MEEVFHFKWLFNIKNELVQGSFYGAVRKLTFLKKLTLILMFGSFLNY